MIPNTIPTSNSMALRGDTGASPVSGSSMIFAVGTYTSFAISASSRFCIRKRKRFSFNSCWRAIARYCFSWAGTDVKRLSTEIFSSSIVFILISNLFSTLATASRILILISRNCASKPVTIGLSSRALSKSLFLRNTISL